MQNLARRDLPVIDDRDVGEDAAAPPATDRPGEQELERRLAEVSERERRLRLAVLASDDEIWEYAIAEDRIAFEHEIAGSFSQQARPADAIHPASGVLTATDNGFNPRLEVAQGHVSVADFLATVHPDHRQAFRDALDALREGRRAYEEVTFRRQSKDGGWVWLQLRGRVAAFDENGRPSLIVGSARDITRMQHNADRLRLSLKAAGEELWELDFARNRRNCENEIFPSSDPAYSREPATEVFARLCHPDDLPAIRKIFLDMRAGRMREFHAVYRSRSPDGAWRWMDAHGCAVDPDDQGIPSRVIGTNRDITAQKEDEQRLHTMFWGSGAELWDIDLVAGVVHRSHMLPGLKLNAHGERLPFAVLMASVSPEHAQMIRDSMVAQVKGLSAKLEIWFRLEAEDGGWRWLHSHGTVVERSSEGRALRMAGTMHDVTAMKKIEDELRVLNEQLEHRVARRTAELTQANAELSQTIQRLDETRAQLVESEKMASLGSLVAGVSHEINTPLGVGITGASHLLEELDALDQDLAAGRLDAAAIGERAALMRECGELVQRSLLRADKLVRSFKQVAVKQSTEPARRLLLDELIGNAVLPFATGKAKGEHVIAVDCAPGIELHTYGDALQQALTALLANSFEHAVVGGKPLRIAIHASQAGTDATIDYRDDGAGMTREVRLRIFDPFFTTRRGQGSLGLGMHIAYNLVTQRLSGRIACASEPGAGTNVIIRIPRQAPDAEG